MSKVQPRLVDLNDAEISAHVQAALTGDSEAMDALVVDLTRIVQLRVARVLARRRSQARGRDLRQDLEDLVQDVFAALFAHNGRVLRRWDPDRGLSFEGFVGFVTERVVGMTLRSGRRNPWTEDPTAEDQLHHLGSDGGVDVLRSVESRQLLERLAEHLRERLTPRGRQYFQLMYIENRPIKDVAEVTGASTQALYAWRNRLTTLLRQLRDEVESEGIRDV